tara:strand:- start:2329 stop:3714 length:1386 start_codon:yes stop_codon:yes gene_type:complete
MGLINDTAQEYYDGNDFGSYQFTSLKDIINQFMLIYVGEDKIIPKAKRMDVAFHAQRALAELSFDTLKSCKAQEITVPASLQMTLPQDYVNYTKISTVDSAGIKHVLYPASKTSNPTNIYQDANGEFTLPGGNPTATFTLASNVLVLDDEYPDILPGMLVKSPHVGDGVNVVYSTATDGTFTSITLRSQANPFVGGTAFVSLFAGTIPIEITTSDGSLHHFSSKSSSANGVTLTAGSAIMTVSAAEIANIEVGMVISMYSTHVQELYGLPLNITVLAINGNDITMSGISGISSISSLNDFNFISPNKPDSTTWSNYKSGQSNEITHHSDYHHHDEDHETLNKRYGLDPQHAQVNGSFYIDCVSGKIHFSSNISGKTVILDYISDSLGTDGEMQVHKFAEEAMYKWISHAILSGKANVPEYQVNRFKKERFAAIRTAKLRLSNLKLEELTQILRGKSKWIKH